MIKKEDQILTDEEVIRLKEEIEGGATYMQAVYATEIPEERADLWVAHGGGKELIRKWEVMSTYSARKLFHSPKDHREAEAVLKRHPLTKKDYSDRVEHDVEVTDHRVIID